VVFALPFFVLALFPGWIRWIQNKSGDWMLKLKFIIGLAEMMAVFKFLSNADLVWGWGLISREVFIAFWIAVFGLCALYLLGKVRLPHDSPMDVVGPVRLVFTLVFLSFSLYLGTGLVGAPLGELDAFFPPYGSMETVGRLRGAPELSWESDYDTALASARQTGKPIFLDFTGYACTNCRWMEANVFTEPEMRDLLSRYVRVRLYTDGQGEIYDRNRAFQQSRFGTVALPFYAVVSPDDKVIAEFAGLTRDRSLFQRFLEQPLEPRGGSD
jgi:thiol:disulfide interchange protein